MAEVTKELMYEVLKEVQARLAQVDGKVDELKQEMQGLRTQLIGIHQEISRIHTRRWSAMYIAWTGSSGASN